MILNLTQQPATPKQIAAGVVDPSPKLAELIRNEFLFDKRPNWIEVSDRVNRLLAYTNEWYGDLTLSLDDEVPPVMIDGPCFMVETLEHSLQADGFDVVYPFDDGDFVWAHNPYLSHERNLTRTQHFTV